MSLTTAELDRIKAIELEVNKIQIAISNLASKTQIRSLSVLKQKEIDDLTSRVEALESQIAILQQNTL